MGSVFHFAKGWKRHGDFLKEGENRDFESIAEPHVEETILDERFFL